jgi:D-alanyl-D-alanine carboxypeptidase
MNCISKPYRYVLALIILLAHPPVSGQVVLPPSLERNIDTIVTNAMGKAGVPGVSIAIVKGGQIALTKAYGLARLEPRLEASVDMRYSIGSISKQFTATAILLLQEAGKLSLNDHVATYLPDLTGSDSVTIRELLSHTSGYQDYWPQDYVMPEMMRPVRPEKILDQWARKPLDFEPGTKWQYSNTNYVIAGMIVEKLSGMPLFQYLQERVFTPLDMKSVRDFDQQGIGENDPIGYARCALGPLRPAPDEGNGWMFAAGELAMTARDLARWDLSIIRKSVMSDASYRQFETEVLLKNGLSTHYALGIGVGLIAGHHDLSHDGETSGFTAQNIVFPEDSAAIVVLTNQDATRAAGAIGRAIAPLLFHVEDSLAAGRLEQARKIFEGLQQGTIDRSLFTDNANSYFSDQALKDCESSLGPLGVPTDFRQDFKSFRGGMTFRVYHLTLGQKSLRVWTYEMPGGKLEQYLIAEQE